MMGEPEHTVQVVEHHSYVGDDTVATLHAFLGKLPNGWSIVDIRYLAEVSTWCAKVSGRRIKASDLR
jgi:hypothetical protein